MAEKQSTFALLPKIINGGIAGIIGVTCVFPIDLVKTRLQNQQIGPQGEKMYNNMFDAFKKVYKSEGFFGMYRGSAVNILLVTPEKAIKLAANDFFRYHLRAPDKTISIFKQMIAGGLAGCCQIVVTTPMELLKIQLQDAGRIASASSIDPLMKKAPERITATKIASKLIREKGISGLYKGTASTMLRDVTFSMIYFPLFATLNGLGPRKKDGSGEAVFWTSFLAGLVGGSFASFCVTPLDVIKTRLQAIDKVAGERSYSGIVNAIVSIMKYEGPTAFFKGGACRMMVIAPLFGIAQTVYFLGVAEYLLGIQK